MSGIDELALEEAAEAAWRTFHEALRKANPGMPPIRLWAEEDAHVRQMYRDMVLAGTRRFLATMGLHELAVEEMAKRDIEADGALQDVAIERRRQVEAEGWTPEHDDEHSNGEMADAAALYASLQVRHLTGFATWPWAAEWWKPTNRRRDLVKAGALIVAEIERLDRAAAKAGAAS